MWWFTKRRGYKKQVAELSDAVEHYKTVVTNMQAKLEEQYGKVELLTRRLRETESAWQETESDCENHKARAAKLDCELDEAATQLEHNAKVFQVVSLIMHRAANPNSLMAPPREKVLQLEHLIDDMVVAEEAEPCETEGQ